MLAASVYAQSTISKEERSKAVEHLKETQSELLQTLSGLSEVQLNYKPTPDTWSIAECMEHIAISENNIFDIIRMSLEKDADPSQRANVKLSDDQLLGIIEGRAQKVKTRKEFEPTNQYGGYDGSLQEFIKQRKAHIRYVKSSKDDLRNRYFDFPFGKVDTYQVILFMSGHTRRHTDQIKEVMADSNFPAA